jgi:hypothetical protein
MTSNLSGFVPGQFAVADAACTAQIKITRRKVDNFMVASKIGSPDFVDARKTSRVMTLLATSARVDKI